MDVLNERVKKIFEFTVALFWARDHYDVGVYFFDARVDAVHELRAILLIIEKSRFPKSLSQVNLKTLLWEVTLLFNK